MMGIISASRGARPRIAGVLATSALAARLGGNVALTFELSEQKRFWWRPVAVPAEALAALAHVRVSCGGGGVSL